MHKSRHIIKQGEKFGRLTVIEKEGVSKWGHSIWRCRCECGNERAILSRSLVTGRSHSCGCLRKELSRQKATKHGESHTRLYKIWSKMLDRCNNANCRAFKDYGGRGITLCHEWHDYVQFSKWAMSSGYSDVLTIDRINNNAGYSPNNCRWATRAEQMRNCRSNNVYKGKCLIEWCEILNIRYDTVKARIYSCKWPLEKAIFTPARKISKKKQNKSEEAA